MHLADHLFLSFKRIGFYTWSSFLSLRPSQAAMATTEEAEELAAALTVTVIAVANNSIVVVEKEKGLAVDIDGRVIVTSSRRRSHMFLLIFNLFHVPAKTRSSPHLLVLWIGETD